MNQDEVLDCFSTLLLVWTLVIGALLFLAQCGSPPIPVPPEPPVLVDSGTFDAGGCQGAEDRLRARNCRMGNGAPRWVTPGGIPFAEVCRDAVNDGRDWQPDTMALEGCE